MPVALVPPQRTGREALRLPARQSANGYSEFSAQWIRWLREGLVSPAPDRSAPVGPRAVRAMFLTLYVPGKSKVRAGLPAPEICARSPRSLFEFLRNEGFGGDVLSRGRLKLDLVTQWHAPKERLKKTLPWYVGARTGQLTTRGESAPEVVLSDDFYEAGESRNGASLDARASVWGEWKSPRTATFATRAFVESATGEGVFEVVRARRLLAPLGPEHSKAVLARCRAAGRWILRGQGEGGEFIYSQDPVNNRSRGGYNIVRHAGTTVALAQLACRTHDTHFLGGALSGLEFLRKLYRAPHEDPDALYVEFEGAAVLGSAALTLLTLVTLPRDEWPEVRSEARALARFIVAQQRPDGSFSCVYNRKGRVEAKNFDSVYYPGEAVLALTRLYERDGDPVHLKAATQGAEALLKKKPFWRKGLEEHFYENAWLMQALPALYEKTGQERYRRECLASALRVVRGQWTDQSGAAEYAGGLRMIRWMPAAWPATCSTAARTEGLVEATKLAAASDGPTRPLYDATIAAGRFLLEQQFDPDVAYFVRSPRDADGCFRESFLVNVTRVDYVQHALSALLGVEHLLRQPRLHAGGIG